MTNSQERINNNFAITVMNNAGFIVEFYINYHIGSNVYKLDSGEFALGTSRTLNIPSNASLAYITIAIKWLQDIRFYNQVEITIKNHCYNFTGTIFNPNVYEIPCSVLGGNDYINNLCYCCCCCKK